MSGDLPDISFSAICREYGAHIDAQADEIARLREALERIMEICIRTKRVRIGEGGQIVIEAVQGIARAALAPKP